MQGAMYPKIRMRSPKEVKPHNRISLDWALVDIIKNVYEIEIQKVNLPNKKKLTKKKQEKTEKNSNFRYIIDVETISIPHYTKEHNKLNTGLKSTGF